MTQKPQNPITKAHFEGVKMFKEICAPQIMNDDICPECRVDFSKLKSFLTTYGINLLKAAYEELNPYLEHSFDCILSYFEAGEPTENGGYRQKYKGKWYQSKPIDKTPKCDCGLDDCLTSFTSAIDEGIEGIKKGEK